MFEDLLLTYDPCANGEGGLQYIEVVPAVAIQTMAIPSGLGFVGPLTLKSGWKWIRIEFDDNTSFYSEIDNDSTQGTSYEIRLGGFYPTDTQTVLEQLELMKLQYWVARARDMDDRWRLVGNISQKLRLSSRKYEITTPLQRRGFQIEFAGVFSRPALFDNRA